MEAADLEPLIERYCQILAPLFECQDDRFDFILALLRAAGHEGAGWDTLAESFRTLDELQSLGSAELPIEHFENPENTRLRLSLLEYCHLVEMDAPYEIIANLCRVRLRKPVSTSPFVARTVKPLQTAPAKKKMPARLLHPAQKIDAIKSLTKNVGLPSIGLAFDDFYRAGIRNAISHSDYIIFNDELRMRSQTIPAEDGSHLRTSIVKLGRLRDLIDKARAFYLAFVRVEKGARLSLGKNRGRGFKYDERYKGILEVLVDDDDYLCGAVIHWPNGTDSSYMRTASGSKPMNILPFDDGLEAFVGDKHAPHDEFSPLLKPGQLPKYTPLRGTGTAPQW